MTQGVSQWDTVSVALTVTNMIRRQHVGGPNFYYHSIKMRKSTIRANGGADKTSFTPSPKVPYEQYSFLSARGLKSLRFEEQSFLESSGCLHLFEKDLLDAFVRAYFLSVHPTLPLVDSKDFCDIYFSRRRQPSRTISLLLFRTLLFAAAEVQYPIYVT